MTGRLNLDKFRKLLEKEKDRIELERRVARANPSADGELTGIEYENADEAESVVEKTIDEALDRNFAALIDQIDAAIAKMDNGTYGICDHCGCEIAEPRLKAIPFAALCVRCQENLERG